MSVYDLSSRSAKFTGKKNSICLCQLIFFLVTYDVFIEMLKIKCLLIFSGSETKENGQTRPPPPCHHGHNREDTVAAPNTDQKVNTWGSFKTKDHFLELHFRWTSSRLTHFFGCHATSSYLMECLCLNR